MAKGTLVKEIILENFMSHEYSRVPLKPGLNMISGPNGAGKSSILLGMAVAVGQTYTERSRKLGDLIKRGKNLGRLSIVFDNARRDGKRPIAGIDADAVVLSRYLSRDGNYWHEVNNRTVVKGEVLRLLGRLSINPDNLLIIMHQNMIDVFGATDPKEKLKLVEEAVGMREYRERILEAMQKLSHALSEEESVANLLEKARETLKYWEGEYQRFERRRGLEAQRKRLELEYGWSKVVKQEEAIDSLQSKLQGLDTELGEIKADLDAASKEEKALEGEVGKLEFDLDSSYQRLIEQERAKAERESQIKISEGLVESLKKVKLPDIKSLVHQLDEDSLRAKAFLKEAGVKTKTTEAKLVELKKKLEKERERYVNLKVKIAVLGFRGELLEKEISRVKGEIRRAKRELEGLEEEASGVGARIKTERKPQDVLEDLRLANAQLASLADVSPDVERMYLSYKSTITDLEEKAKITEANRRRALVDLELRKKRWQEEIAKLLKGVREEYRGLLERLNGAGDVELTNPQDVEDAGLELSVGYKGVEPQILNAYTQSGGERTTALMCFMLALQRRIKSPIRAIDEFEAHLDPRNRETIMQSIIESMKGEEAQYVVITPGRLSNVEKVPNVITVQNVAGVSNVKAVA